MHSISSLNIFKSFKSVFFLAFLDDVRIFMAYNVPGPAICLRHPRILLLRADGTCGFLGTYQQLQSSIAAPTLGGGSTMANREKCGNMMIVMGFLGFLEMTVMNVKFLDQTSSSCLCIVFWVIYCIPMCC